MKNKQFFILIILLVIGFASISATLIINGNTKVAANLDDFNVIFIEGFLNGETNEDVVISGDKKTLTFTTNKLTNINDSARIDYKVKNISTQYDGNVTINCTNAANDYVNIISSFDGKNLPLTNSINMQAQEVKTGYINAELTKATTEDQEVKITCKIEVSATSRTNYAYSLSFDSNGGTNVEDKIVEYNSNYGELSVPEKEGYTFIGWFNEDDVRVDETTVFDTKGNKTLTAKWAEKAYPVEIRKVYADKTETETINIPYGEYVDALITVGEEYYISNIECNNEYTIENFNKEELIFGEQTIRINNNRIVNSSTCTVTVIQGIFTYSYTGAEQKFVAQASGNYKVELWGAQGGGTTGGNGAYTKGQINIPKNTEMFVYVGGNGVAGDYHTGGSGGYNGGAKAQDSSFNADGNTIGGGGGGATDIRITNGSWQNFDSLKSRIMIAAGGGGSEIFRKTTGGASGGLTGYNGGYARASHGSAGYGSGATQKSGGIGSIVTSGYNSSTSGGFGYGSTPPNYSFSSKIYNPGGGGGGGYYAGGTSPTGYDSYAGGGGGGWYGGLSYQGIETNSDASGSGGSGFIGNSSLISKLMYCYNCAESSSESTKTISTTCTSMTPTTNCSKQGNGYAKITYLGK